MVAGEGLGRFTELFADGVQVIPVVTQLFCVTTPWGCTEGHYDLSLSAVHGRLGKTRQC